MNKESFVEQITKRKMYRPPYFRKMESFNLDGPPLLSKVSVPQPLTVDEFEREMQKSKTVVVDAREPSAFAGSHISGSLNIWLDGLSFFPGWVLIYDQRVLLVTEQIADVKTAKVYLQRLGFDNVIGYLCPNIRAWRDAGKPIDFLGALSATALKDMLDKNEILLLDVREEREWIEERIEGSKNIYVGHLKEEADRMPRDKPVATTCEWGGRGSLGASILKNMGFTNVYNVLGGMSAWRNLEYPIKHE